MCDLAGSRAETTVQHSVNEELKEKHFVEAASLHARIDTAESNENAQRARAAEAEARLEEATASYASEMEAMSTTLDQLHGDLNAAYANSASDKRTFVTRLETLERDLNACQAEVAAGLVVNTKLREKHVILQAHASAVEVDRDAQHARAETAEAKLDEALASYQAAHDELRISQDETSTLSASIDRLREDLEAAKTDGEAKDAIITSQEARIEELEESDALKATVIKEQRVRREEDTAVSRVYARFGSRAHLNLLVDDLGAVGED